MGADGRGNNGVVAPYERRPPAKSLLLTVRYFFWNPDERTVMGRTGRRWGIIGLIYLVMYICIVVFFSLCMCGLLHAMDDRVPYYTLADSIIGDNPGMAHRPLLYEDGSLIWYNADNTTQVHKYVENIDLFLAPYMNKSLLPNKGINQRECDRSRPARNEVYSFNISQFGPCSPHLGYGFASRTPCLIIKLNKIYDWNPVLYDDPASLPSDMPSGVVEHINTTATLYERQMVWVSCSGERSADREAIGPVRYWPQPGLPSTYFPYDNTPGYLSPLVAVQLVRPKLHQIINIRCRAWARNIRFTDSLKDRLASTHVEIMID